MTAREIAAFRELAYANRLQAEVIDSLFGELCLHISEEEAGAHPSLQMMKEAAEIAKSFEHDIDKYARGEVES